MTYFIIVFSCSSVATETGVLRQRNNYCRRDETRSAISLVTRGAKSQRKKYFFFRSKVPFFLQKRQHAQKQRQQRQQGQQRTKIPRSSLGKDHRRSSFRTRSQ